MLWILTFAYLGSCTSFWDNWIDSQDLHTRTHPFFQTGEQEDIGFLNKNGPKVCIKQGWGTCDSPYIVGLHLASLLTIADERWLELESNNILRTTGSPSLMQTVTAGATDHIEKLKRAPSICFSNLMFDAADLNQPMTSSHVSHYPTPSTSF